MIHILCYLHGGGSGREGRQLWSSAWLLCLALGLTCRSARLSVWSPHPLCVVLVFSLFITLLFSFSTSTPLPLSSAPLLSLLCTSHTFASPYSSSCYTVPPSSSSSPESGSALNFSSQATCCLPEPKNAATGGIDRGPGFWHKEWNKSQKKKTQNKDGKRDNEPPSVRLAGAFSQF